MLAGVDLGLPHFDGELAELDLLARSCGLTPVAKIVCKRQAPDAALFVGSGKADEIAALAAQHQASEVLFDQALSPGQQRNLERRLDLPVNDRTLLILDIFAQRARSHEGKLQVELARLQYQSTRLVRRWSHLERQRGGIGTRGGPGEAQIELDRRMIAQAIKRTRERLLRLKRQRHTQRRQRERSGALAVSLVGYTNAGKSTLFNTLTHANSYAADQLFATLDTTTRQLYLGAAVSKATLSDTVGFIRALPHDLIEAFAATLEEAAQADLLLHVVDAVNPEHQEQIAQVQQVLQQVGAEQVPQWLIFNKLDALPEQQQPQALSDSAEYDGQRFKRFFVSAEAGTGLSELRLALAQVAQEKGGAHDNGSSDCLTPELSGVSV